MSKRTGWGREFEDPIELPAGRVLVTLHDAATYITEMQALNRNKVREFNPNRKDHHWSRRKLKRDR
jgi:hypothetical protein